MEAIQRAGFSGTLLSAGLVDVGADWSSLS